MNNRMRVEMSQQDARRVQISRLREAIEHNNVEKADNVLREYSDIHVLLTESINYEHKFNFFEEACLKGRLDIVKLMVNKMTLANLVQSAHQGENALSLSLKSENICLIDFFTSKGWFSEDKKQKTYEAVAKMLKKEAFQDLSIVENEYRYGNKVIALNNIKNPVIEELLMQEITRRRAEALEEMLPAKEDASKKLKL